MSRRRRRRHSRSRAENTFFFIFIGGLATLGFLSFTYQYFLNIGDYVGEIFATLVFVFVGLVVTLVVGIPAVKFYIKSRKQLEQYHRYHNIRQVNAFQRMDPYDFEDFVAWVFEQQGYKATPTPKGPDQGIDTILEKNGKKYGVQSKRYKTGHNVKSKEVQSFYGACISRKYENGFFVTSSNFTFPAKIWAMTTPLKLIDGNLLANMVNNLKSDEWHKFLNEAGTYELKEEFPINTL